MKRKLTTTLLLIFTILGAGAQSVNAQSSKKPNLVLFMADDCSYYDLGIYGSKDSKTPNIDQFAREGLRFTKAYQAAPMCSPTRHNLFTGLWPVNTGAYPNHTFAKEGTLSIVQQLQPAGYKVALVGKSHVEPESVFPWDLRVPLKKNRELDFAAIDSFINACNSRQEPFCLLVMSNQPHTPWNKGNPELFNPSDLTLPPFYVDIPETREAFSNYLAEVNFMDQEFGTLLNSLEKQGVSDESVVVYLSEQGNSLPFAKWTCYDAGVHSGCIIRWPGVIEPGTVTDALVEYVDMVPTFLEIAGTKPLAKLDGKSMVPLLKGETDQHKEYTFSLQTTRGIIKGSEYYGIRSVADSRYRYIVNLTPEATFQNTESEGELFKQWQQEAEHDTLARQITHKYQHRPAIELYDIEKDPYCMNNLAANPKYGAVISRMDRALKAWMASSGDRGQATELQALDHQFKKNPGKNRRKPKIN